MSLPEIDTFLLLFVNNGLQNSFFDAVMPFVTRNVALLFSPLVVWAFLKERRDALLFLVVAICSVAVSDGSGYLLKELFARPRPCHDMEYINLLVGCGKSFSMPSNHAANAFAFAMTFLFFRKNAVSCLLLFAASVVGFSRVYVGVHYPSDVFAGMLLGTVVARVSISLYVWAENIYKEKSYGQALVLLLLLMSMLRIYYILTGPLDLSPDEAHYWEWSRRLDWSYYSKGPMIAYLIYAGTAVFGDNVFGVRILAVVLSALSSIILYKLGRELYDKRTGFVSSLLVQVVPLYSVYGVLLTIDSPFIFFWILSLFFFHRSIQRQQHPAAGRYFNYNWIFLGVSVGLGLLTKYTMAFFYLSGFLYMLFNKESRRFFAAAGPYAAFVVSMVIFSPVLLWNAAHGWVTIKHTAGQAHIAEGFMFSAESFFEFLGSQVGVVTPVLFLLILMALWKLRKNREGAFLFWFAVPVISFFIFKSIQGKVQANWALTAYATGFVAFSAYFIRHIEQSKKSLKLLIAAGFLLAFAVTVFAHFPKILSLPSEMDPTTRLVGWKKLGREASRVYNEMSLEGPLFIFSDRYQVSSELAFYMETKPVTYCINIGRRMNQYDLWPGVEGFLGQNALFVRAGDKRLPEEIQAAFLRCEREVLEVKHDKGKKVNFTLFKCYDFRGIEIKPAETF